MENKRNKKKVFHRALIKLSICVIKCILISTKKYLTVQLFLTLIRRKCFCAANQHIIMISEGSCDTEDRSNDVEKYNFAITFYNYI